MGVTHRRADRGTHGYGQDHAITGSQEADEQRRQSTDEGRSYPVPRRDGGDGQKTEDQERTA